MAALALCRAIDLPLARCCMACANIAASRTAWNGGAIDDVEYYDDSKGTNVGATVAALNGLGKRVVLIAGGDGKGQDFAPLAAPVAQYARAVVLIGRDAPQSARRWAPARRSSTPALEDAVEKSAALAQAGDAVLLSPACASLDMFRNYAHRAQVFRGAVREPVGDHAMSDRRSSAADSSAPPSATPGWLRRGVRRQADPSRMMEYDQPLVWVIVLLMFGLVMVYSASIALPDSPRYANYRENIS
jgi:hypothetical protein